MRTQTLNYLRKKLLMLNLAVIAYAAGVLSISITKRRSTRRKWVRAILHKRNVEGTHNLLLPQLLSDGFHYKNFLRMDKDSYHYLLNLVEPIISKKKFRRR